jgi:uncharacterized protein YdhG (YjbR/CyaY superfamily)
MVPRRRNADIAAPADAPTLAGMTTPPTVDEYIARAPEAAQPTLRELRTLVRAADPEATERIKYGMPTYEHGGQSLLNFSAAKRHVAVYGLVHVEGSVPPQLAPHLHERSTLRFGFGEPLPAAALRAAIEEKVKRQAAGTR